MNHPSLSYVICPILGDLIEAKCVSSPSFAKIILGFGTQLHICKLAGEMRPVLILDVTPMDVPSTE